MERLRDEPFAGAVLARHENVRVRRRPPGDQFDHRPHPRRFGKNVRHLATEPPVFGFQLQAFRGGPAGRDRIARGVIGGAGKDPQGTPGGGGGEGHTAVGPVGGGKTNWDLSASRAIAVVQYLITRGLSPQRLVAAGFGEFQPIDPGTTEEAYSKNRRIELRLTDR